MPGTSTSVGNPPKTWLSVSSAGLWAWPGRAPMGTVADRPLARSRRRALGAARGTSCYGPALQRPAHGLPGVSPDVLAQRLRELEQGGSAPDQLPPPASARVYELTERGRKLEPVVIELGQGRAVPVRGAARGRLDGDRAQDRVRPGRRRRVPGHLRATGSTVSPDRIADGSSRRVGAKPTHRPGDRHRARDSLGAPGAAVTWPRPSEPATSRSAAAARRPGASSAYSAEFFDPIGLSAPRRVRRGRSATPAGPSRGSTTSSAPAAAPDQSPGPRRSLRRRGARGGLELALDDAGLDPLDEVEREIGTVPHADVLRPPAEKARVEGTGAREVGRGAPDGRPDSSSSGRLDEAGKAKSAGSDESGAPSV